MYRLDMSVVQLGQPKVNPPDFCMKLGFTLAWPSCISVGCVCAIMLYQIVPMSIVDCQHLNWCFLSTTHCIVVVHSSRAQSSAAGLDITFILHITWGQALKNVDWRQQNHYYPQEYTTLNCSELTLLKRQKKSWCNNIFTMQFGRENSL